MSLSGKGRALGKFALALLVVGGGGYAIRWFEELADRDPFENYRILPGEGDGVGIRLEDVSLRHYSAAKLVAEASMNQIDVRRDRQHFDLFDIGNGVYHLEEGDFKFSAPHASYDTLLKRMVVESGARVTSSDFDLTMPRFTYSENEEILTAPDSIKGRLFEGEVEGRNLVLNVPLKEFELGPVVWKGTLKAQLDDLPQEAQAATQSKWSVSGDKVKRSGNKDTFTNGSATDGEILVKAQTIERDVKTDVITATGKVYYFSAKTNMICDKAVIYRKEKRAVLSGNVTMMVKPADKQELELAEVPPFRPTVPDEVAANRPPAPASAQEDQQKDLDDEVRSLESRRKYPVVVRSEQVEYWYAKGSRRAVITGSPQARQELAAGRWRQIWTHHAQYDGEKERLKLLSEEGKQQVRMKTSLGDDLYATVVELSTKENDDEYEAENVKGDLYPDEEDVEKAKEGGGGGG